MITTIIENNVTGEIIEFKDKIKFTEFIRKIYFENEDGSDIKLNKIRNYSDAIYYVKKYCGNFDLKNF